MKSQPIKSEPGYTIGREYTGASTEKQYVVRFCGEYVGQSPFYASAVVKAVGHNAIRNKAEVVTENTVRS